MASEHSTHPNALAFPEFAARLPGHDQLWLQAFRNRAAKLFSQSGLPTLRDEDWRYTNLAALNKALYAPSDSRTVDSAWLDSFRLPNAWCVVLLNGRFSAELSNLTDLPAAVRIQSVQQVLQDNPASLQSYLGQAVTENLHTLVAFNNAWFGDGVVIDIPAQTSLAKPIQILQVVTAEHALAATRNFWILNENAEAEIIETFAGSANSYLTVAVNEVFLASDAHLTAYKVQLEADTATHFGGVYLQQAERSQFEHHNFALGGLIARSDIYSDLDTGAECSLNGLAVGTKRQHLDNLTRINHLKPHGLSREYYKTVLDQRARGVFQGRVVVAEDAQKTDTQMNNRNLLLSADAEIDTKPQLEIYADDVKCSHGVTVGQLDDKSVFYLQSRGLDEASARNIQTFAFANEMVEKVENAELKDLLRSQLLAHFPAISL